MYAIIAGSGKLGAGLARALCRQGHDVAVVDRPLERRKLGSAFDGLTVEGDPLRADSLEAAGIRQADLFVAATADDNLNAAAAQAAKEIYGVAKVVARLADPDKESFYRELGFGTVCPTTEGINMILEFLREGEFGDLRAAPDPGLACVLAPAEWRGRRPRELRLPPGDRVAGIVRDGRTLDRPGEATIREGDSILVSRRRGGRA